MNKDKTVSLPVIKRLPRYYRYLGDLLDNNIDRISSKELSIKMGITASQIRQDLNNFGCFGQQGYGYNVELLYLEIQKILGLDKTYNMIVIGGGNIGQALLNYTSFRRRGFNFTAVFDVNPEIIGKTFCDVLVNDISELEDFLKNNKVDIAILTLPKSNAISVSKTIINLGIKAIWNFSNTDLQAPSDVVVENVHLSDSLMTLSYKLNEEDIIRKYLN